MPIEIIDSANLIDSYSNLIKILPKDQYVFVDIWASWCGPCISEFSYNKIVDSFLLKNKISKIYISFDRLQDKPFGMKAIDKYKLGGKHILCSEKFKSSLKAKLGLGCDALMPIPRYLFINKQGELINANAPRPSSGNDFFTQMKKDFNLKAD